MSAVKLSSSIQNEKELNWRVWNCVVWKQTVWRKQAPEDAWWKRSPTQPHYRISIPVILWELRTDITVWSLRCPDILSSHNEYIRSPQRTFKNIWDPRECRKHSPTARIFYISLVFSNARRVSSQSNTRHRRLYLLSRIRIRSLELLLLKLAERKLRAYHRHKNENLLHFSISFKYKYINLSFACTMKRFEFSFQKRWAHLARKATDRWNHKFSKKIFHIEK